MLANEKNQDQTLALGANGKKTFTLAGSIGTNRSLLQTQPYGGIFKGLT